MMQLRCPTCRRTFEEADSPTPPFCCERCKMIDLGNWLNEDYAVPNDGDDEQEESFEGEF